MSQNRTEKQIIPFKTTISYLMIWDAIYSLIFLVEKLAIFNKQ